MSKKEILDRASRKATEMVVAALEKGVAVWTQPWAMVSGDHGLGSKRPYRGVNVLMCAAAKTVLGVTSSSWLTWGRFKELQKEDPSISMRKGAKAVPVVYWMRIERRDCEGNVVLDEDGQPESFLWPKTYNVFNADFFENLDVDAIEKVKALDEVEVKSIDEHFEALVASYPGCPEIRYTKEGRAFYRPSEHMVSIPEPRWFNGEAEAYSTFAHELVHSTGKALGRDQSGWFGDEKYSYEELVAECGATILCAHAGYLEQTVENSAAYLDGWALALKRNPSWLADAMRDAEKAVALILGDGSVAAYSKKEEVA